MRLPTLTGEFRVGSDPELRFTPTGKAVCSISLIATESKKTDTGWEDGDSTPWINVSLWDTAAEEAAERITKGMRVLATGALYVRKYERRDGGEGQSIELKYATVALIPGGEPRTQRSTTGSGSGYAEDPWTTPASPPGSGTVHHVPSDPWDVGSQEPPF